MVKFVQHTVTAKLVKGNNPETCLVCMTVFDVTVKRPHTLPCGHTLCTPCINGLKEHDQVTCPVCCVKHAVPESGQFPVSYTVEAFIRKLRGTEEKPAPPLKPEKSEGKARQPAQRGTSGLTKKLRSFLQEQEAIVLTTITTSQDVQAQLEQYQAALAGWTDQQQELEDGLQSLIDQSRLALQLVRQEKAKVEAKKHEEQEGEHRLQAVLQTMRTLTTEQEVGEAVIDMFRSTDEAEQRVQECREMFPDADSVTTVTKIRRVTRAALDAVQMCLETTSGPSAAARNPDLQATTSINDRLQALLPPSLKAEDVLNMRQTTRSLLQAGRVFAANQVEGRTSHARISLAGDRLYLHALQEQALPGGVSTVQVSEVVPHSFPCLAFLDLVWSNSTPRRILIRLSPDTPRGRQFVLLCTGQLGPSFASTRLWGVFDKGKPGECVCGGDYETNNGEGGASLLPDLDVGDYRKTGRAGSVFGWMGCTPALGALFGIITRSEQDGHECDDVFGEVVEGLCAVTEAAKQRNIKEVTVVDCGVVLKI